MTHPFFTYISGYNDFHKFSINYQNSYFICQLSMKYLLIFYNNLKKNPHMHSTKCKALYWRGRNM